MSDSEVLAGQHDDRRLEAALAQELDRLAAVHVGQADIHHHEIDTALARLLDALGAGRLLIGLELLVERKLLDQALAEDIVVIDDQNLAVPACRGLAVPSRIRAGIPSESAAHGVDLNPRTAQVELGRDGDFEVDEAMTAEPAVDPRRGGSRRDRGRAGRRAACGRPAPSAAPA